MFLILTRLIHFPRRTHLEGTSETETNTREVLMISAP